MAMVKGIIIIIITDLTTSYTLGDDSSFITVQVEWEFRSVVQGVEGKSENRLEKNPWSEKRTSNKLSSHTNA